MKRILFLMALITLPCFAQQEKNQDLTVDKWVGVSITDAKGDTVDITGYTVRIKMELEDGEKTKKLKRSTFIRKSGVEITDPTHGTITIYNTDDSKGLSGAYELDFEGPKGKLKFRRNGKIKFKE